MEAKLKELHADLIAYEIEHIVTVLNFIPLSDLESLLREKTAEWEHLAANFRLDNTDYQSEIMRLKHKKDVLEKLVELKEICKRD